MTREERLEEIRKVFSDPDFMAWFVPTPNAYKVDVEFLLAEIKRLEVTEKKHEEMLSRWGDHEIRWLRRGKEIEETNTDTILPMWEIIRCQKKEIEKLKANDITRTCIECGNVAMRASGAKFFDALENLKNENTKLKADQEYLHAAVTKLDAENAELKK